MRLEGQVAIITGVSHTGQVGYELASAFAREGAILAISSRSAERTNARARELRAEGAKVVAIPADLTTEQGASALVQKTLDEYGRINILVNLAGGVQSAGPMMLAYNCAKAGIDALTRTFAKEGRNAGIYVNAIGPGLIITQSNVESMKPSPEELSKKWVSMEQIVEAAIFLLTPASDGITGAILPVQGKGI